MKRTVLLMTMIAFVAALLIGGQATAATTPAIKAQSFKLPNGSKLLTEINMSDDDLLMVIKEAIPAFLQGFSAGQSENDGSEATVKMSNGHVSGFSVPLGNSDLNEVFETIKGIKALRIETFSPAADSNVDELFSFFESQVPASKGWNRIFYSVQIVPGVLVAVYSQNNQRYMAIALDSAKELDIVASMEGFIDVPKLAQSIGKMVSSIVPMFVDEDDNSISDEEAQENEDYNNNSNEDDESED